MRKLLSSRRITRALAGTAVLAAGIGLVAFPGETMESAKEGLRLCFNVIIPTLFPFFVLSSLIIELGFVRYLGWALEGIMRPLFNVNGSCAAALILGIIGGYPTGARTAIGLYEKKLCTKEEAERLLSFCNNSGPAFILGVVGAGVFSSSRAGLLLYLAHIAASVAVGIIFRFYKRGSSAGRSQSRVDISSASFSSAFIKSVTSSFSSTLNICAFVIFFTVLIRLLFLSGILPAIAGGIGLLLSPFGFDGAAAENLLTGFLEVSSGVWALRDAAGTLQGKLAMAAFMLGWAGISVHCQVLSFVGESKLNARTYFVGKALHGLLSALFVYAAAGLFSFESPVSSLLADQIRSLTSLGFADSLLFSLSSVAVVCVLFLLIALLPSRRRKRRN